MLQRRHLWRLGFHAGWNGRWVLYVRRQNPHVRLDQEVGPINSPIGSYSSDKAYRTVLFANPYHLLS